MNIPTEVAEIADKLKHGQAVEKVSVSKLLSWFGRDRRGWRVVSEIREALTNAGIGTVPDFDTAGYYWQIGFEQVGIDGVVADPTLRLRLLDQATQKITCCSPQNPLSKIVPVMMMEDFSQVPVTTGPRDVKGVVTWETIARSAILRKPHAIAQDVMVPAEIADSDEPLSEVIPRIARAGYVLVRAADRQISGIVTSSDLNDILVRLSEAFLSLGEIEGNLRLVIRHKFNQKELEGVCRESDRKVSGPQDLTMGQLIALVEKPENWSKLKLPVERDDFVRNLVRVRDIRNDVMHFDPDGIASSDQVFLTKFRNLLRNIVSLA